MKVAEPEFVLESGELANCAQCPFDEIGRLCGDWLRGHSYTCPTAETYAEACKLAEEV